MQVITKHYVEEFFPVNPDRGSQFESLVRTISEREPLKIYDNLVSYFRFFDITEAILDDGEVLCGQRKNYSCTYYCGKRLNRNEISELGTFWENFCIEKGINSVIKCYNGSLITNPSEGSITIDELQESKKHSISELDHDVIPKIIELQGIILDKKHKSLSVEKMIRFLESAMNYGKFQIWLLDNQIDGIKLSTNDKLRKFLEETSTDEILTLYDIEQNYDDANLENVVQQTEKGPILEKIRK